MSSVTRAIRSSPERLPGADYAKCCGVEPIVYYWEKLESVAVNCSNPECKNATTTTFEGKSGIHAKWEGNRHGD